MRIDPWEGPGDEHVEWPEPVSVRKGMSSPAVTVPATASLAEALRRMIDNRIHCLPVVDDDGGLIGIVNEDDVLGTRWGARPAGDTVAAAMSSPAVWVGPSATLKEAMQLMVGRSIGAVPVVEDGRVIGILTQGDVVSTRAH